MDEYYENVVGLVRTLAEQLVSKPEAVEVDGEVNDEGTLLVTIKVDEDDCGKIIGRQGRIIKAIRLLARAASAQHDFFAEVELAE
ncbi:MAG: KH domain-containing protein [Coriobacteriaceae bacterium]|nr:KH domain-containing protein [Coriobacteriaceae bacterium]